MADKQRRRIEGCRDLAYESVAGEEGGTEFNRHDQVRVVRVCAIVEFDRQSYFATATQAVDDRYLAPGKSEAVCGKAQGLPFVLYVQVTKRTFFGAKFLLPQQAWPDEDSSLIHPNSEFAESGEDLFFH